MEETFTYFKVAFLELIVIIQANQPQAMTALFLAGMVGGSRNSVVKRALWIVGSYFPILFSVVTICGLFGEGKYNAIVSTVILVVAAAITWKANYTGDKNDKK